MSMRSTIVKIFSKVVHLIKLFCIDFFPRNYYNEVEYPPSSLKKGMMQMRQVKKNHWIQLLLLLALALVSIFLLAKLASSPATHAATIQSLEAKRSTIMELTAGASAASIAVAAIPGDATTPIANELAQLNSFFVISLGAVLLEKYLLTIIGYGVFKFMLPVACALTGLGILLRNFSLRTIGIKLALAGLAFFFVIPVSVGVSDLIEHTYQVSSIVEVDVTELEEAAQSVIEEEEALLAEDVPTEEKHSLWSIITNGISQLEENVSQAVQNAASSLTEAAESAKKTAEETLNRFVEALAVIIVTTCLIPLLTLSFFLWLLQTLSGIQFSRPMLPPHHHGKHRHYEDASSDME